MEKEEIKESVVEVNTDKKKGPLDGASALVKLVKTSYKKGPQGEEFAQTIENGKINASYELGVISFTVHSKRKIMVTARIDEVMQVLFASSKAYKKLHVKEDKKNV